MDLRPSAARWFEILVPREDAGDAMEALARRGQVQFEWTGERTAALDLADLAACVARYRAAAEELGRFWPEPVFEKRCCTLPVEASAKAAVRTIERWRARAAPQLARLAELQRQRGELDLWSSVLEALDDTALDLGALAGAGPALRGFCLLLPAQAPAQLPDLEVHAEVRVGERCALLGLVAAERVSALCEGARGREGRCLELPAWFRRGPSNCLSLLPERRAALERRISEAEGDLCSSAEEEGVDRAAGLLERVDWVRRHAQDMRCSGQYCWITGWTREEDAQAMNEALREVGVGASIALVEPPRDVSSPSVTRNPVWLEAFEVFTRAVGVPDVREADPTTWVALLVPLLFGYMCGDVGHGLVILTAGLVLRTRTRLWPLLAAAGISSMGFGFAYGDVFGYHHLIDPLWLRPMNDPFTVLVAPMGLGALVLTLGVLLHAVGTCWQGEAGSGGVADAAQLLVYWGLLLALVDLRLAWLAVAGVGLCMGGRLWSQRSAMALLTGFGQLLESTLQLLLNTLSFARVGAFALAHAALQSAVLAMADAVSTPAVAAFIVVLGNLVVVLVEGMVVSIQTTRLVLFEFFMRFFEGRGRPFEPVPKPPTASR